MGSSKSQRDDLKAGVTLAGALGLSGAILLSLGRPVATSFPFSSRPRDTPSEEMRRVSHDAPLDIPDTAPDDAPTPAPRSIAAASAEPEPESAPPPVSAETVALAPIAPIAPRGGLSAVLRASGLACLDGREVLLSPGERDLCRERLGALTRAAPSLSPSIDPEARAVAPLTARGVDGSFVTGERPRTSHGPRLGCSVKFGPGADSALAGPNTILRAGPCFIRLPAGALGSEASVRRSD